MKKVQLFLRGFLLGRPYLSAEEALAFSRMRYEDPREDYGRQKRQHDVIAAVAKKTLSHVLASV